ncbi:MAG: hypothetical protein RBS91_00095 [Sulfurimonadaceae bacterium]|jgi:hypothetical protein|nr:hypothetical protein [Sulfurimonadaceae bacterium]
MKKSFLALTMVASALLAKEHTPSPIPLPSLYIQNLSSIECSQKCLIDFMNKKKIFSFLASTSYELDSDLELLDVNYQKLIAIYSQKPREIMSGEAIKIALLLPYNSIGKYASSVTNSTLSYLMLKNYPYELRTYKIDKEDEQSIEIALKQIKQDGFKYVIAPLTKLGEASMPKAQGDMLIYIPTINKRDAKSSYENIYYGAIDYKAQSDALLEYATNKLYIFSDNSRVAQEVSEYQQQSFNGGVAKVFTLPPEMTSLESVVKKSSGARGGSIFINAPIVKSSMILTQLTLYDIKAQNILSIQTNYTPLLFRMTQYNDRKNIILANSIVKNNDLLDEVNSLLDNDISYDWINYTTSVGADFFAHLAYDVPRDFDIELKDNGFIYPIELLTPSVDKFIEFY